MAYQPFVQSRAISQTRPGLEDEESIRNKAKAAAARQALGTPRVQRVPSVMPTGNAPAPAVAARDTIVDSTASQAAAQGVTGPSTTPQFDMNMAMGTSNDSNNNPAQGGVTGSRARQALSSSGHNAGIPLHMQPTDEGFDDPYTTGSQYENWEEGGVSSQEDFLKTHEGRQWDRENPDAGPTQWNPAKDLGPIYDTDLTAEESILMGRDKDFLEMKDLTGEDLLGGGRGNPNDRGGGDAGPGGGNEGGEGGDDGPSDFRTELEKLLLSKLNEDPTAVAREDALRSIMAQRQTQAGRGTGGMYAMHKLGMDTANEAARVARAEGFKDQLGAAKMGVGLEALDKADRMAVLDFVENSDLPPKAMAQFLQDYMGLSAEEASSIQSSREAADREQKSIDVEEAEERWADHEDSDGNHYFNSYAEMEELAGEHLPVGWSRKKDENGNGVTIHIASGSREGSWKVYTVEESNGNTYDVYVKA